MILNKMPTISKLKMLGNKYVNALAYEHGDYRPKRCSPDTRFYALLNVFYFNSFSHFDMKELKRNILYHMQYLRTYQCGLEYNIKVINVQDNKDLGFQIEFYAKQPELLEV